MAGRHGSTSNLLLTKVILVNRIWELFVYIVCSQESQRGGGCNGHLPKIGFLRVPNFMYTR